MEFCCKVNKNNNNLHSEQKIKFIFKCGLKKELVNQSFSLLGSLKNKSVRMLFTYLLYPLTISMYLVLVLNNGT